MKEGRVSGSKTSFSSLMNPHSKVCECLPLISVMLLFQLFLWCSVDQSTKYRDCMLSTQLYASLDTSLVQTRMFLLSALPKIFTQPFNICCKVLQMKRWVLYILHGMQVCNIMWCDRIVCRIYFVWCSANGFVMHFCFFYSTIPC